MTCMASIPCVARLDHFQAGVSSLVTSGDHAMRDSYGYEGACFRRPAPALVFELATHAARTDSRICACRCRCPSGCPRSCLRSCWNSHRTQARSGAAGRGRLPSPAARRDSRARQPMQHPHSKVRCRNAHVMPRYACRSAAGALRAAPGIHTDQPGRHRGRSSTTRSLR